RVSRRYRAQTHRGTALKMPAERRRPGPRAARAPLSLRSTVARSPLSTVLRSTVARSPLSTVLRSLRSTVRLLLSAAPRSAGEQPDGYSRLRLFVRQVPSCPDQPIAFDPIARSPSTAVQAPPHCRASRTRAAYQQTVRKWLARRYRR